MDREHWPLKTRSGGMEDDDEEEEEEEEEEQTTEKDRISPVAMDLLKKERTLMISEDVSPKLTRRIGSSLLWLDSQGSDPIKLFINTPGGSADDGFAVHDMIRFIKAPVYCICVGLNASAGTLILLAAPKKQRLALPNARLMLHQPSGGGRGTSSDIDITAEEILKLRQRANKLISKETGQPAEQVEKDTDRDFWLSAKEAKEYGLVSKVITKLGDVF